MPATATTRTSRLQLRALACNLGIFMRTLAMPKIAKLWWIKEGKGAIKWTRLSCRSFAERCALITGKRWFPPSSGERPDVSAPNQVGRDQISLRRASMRRNITLKGPGIPGNVG
jgi:hypothetical protein